MKFHYLKCVQPHFDNACAGRKPYEVRFNDRDFKVDDAIVLRRHPGDGYSRPFKIVLITEPGEHVPLPPGYVILSLQPMTEAV